VEEAALIDILAQSLWFVMALVLVGSSLALRRLPRGNLIRLVLIWIVIIGGAWLLVVAVRSAVG
jgi:hypothetical protein